MWLLKLLNRLGIRRDKLICMRQENTYFWSANLGERTPGFCCECNAPIYFEKQNWVFKRKMCHVCMALENEVGEEFSQNV